MKWQSPISPGLSWYQSSGGERPEFQRLNGSRRTDVAVIGGGYTGLSAAYGLAKAGLSVVLLEASRVGDGASGRNGGQLGTGQRSTPDEHEKHLGFARAKALFDLSEEAKSHLLGFAQENAIDIDYMPGHLSVAHKDAYEREYRELPDILSERYGYRHMRFLDRGETAERLGSKAYAFGLSDEGTGHIHPLKLLFGLVRATRAAGADVCEQTPVRSLKRSGGRIVIETPHGTVTAERALLATNAHVGALEPVTAAHIMPIRSFIGTTEPLDAFPDVLPGGESVADSRFVVRYFRKTKDNRLLFGGREAYTADAPSDISRHIRRQISEIYPSLRDVAITHAWGGSVGITLPREPFVREVMPGLTSIGGYSGHGVVLANFCGRLYAEAVVGGEDRLAPLKQLNVPPFPGGRMFQKPLLFFALSWFAFRDRF